MIGIRICSRMLFLATLLAAALVPMQARAQGQGMLVAWGDNTYGQAQYPNWGGIKAIAAGQFHTLVVRYDNTVQCWGSNSYGECNVPAGLTDVVAVAGGSSTSMALKSDGTVVNWGYATSWFPGMPAGLNGVVAIACGVDHKLALKSDGTIVAWGDNVYGQASAPAGLTGVTAIAAGGYHTVALKSDGTVAAWGYNDSGQCNVPAGLTGVTAVAGGFNHTIALKSDGTVVAWGSNVYGQCNVPAGLTGVKAIAAGWYHCLALKSDGTVVTWGLSGYNLGSVPVGRTGVVAIAGGELHSLALYNTNRPPVANAGGNRTVTAVHTGDPATDCVTLTLDGSGSSDPDNDTLSYTWIDSGYAIVGTGATLDLTLAPGTYTYTLEVADPSSASDSDQAIITVAPAANQAPTADAGTDQTVAVPHNNTPDVGTASFTLDGSASSDPENDTLSYDWTDASNNHVGNTAQLPLSMQAGTYVYTLTVTDAYGASSQDSVTITVNPESNGAPVLTAPAAAQGDVGCPLTIATSATDPDGDPLTYSLVGPTYGATINSNTGLVSWTPSAGGTYTLTVKAADPYSASSTKSVSISVCPIIIEAVTVSRTVSKNSNVVTVQFNVRNTGSTTVTGISLNSATLKGVNTTTKMPVSIGTLRAGMTQKAVKLTFSGASVQAGSAVFIVNGTSSAGLVCANMSVNVP